MLTISATFTEMSSRLIWSAMNRHTFHGLVFACWATLAFFAAEIPAVESTLASPHPFQYMQPDGNTTPPIMLQGGPLFNYMSDMSGYTVMMDDAHYYVYAMPESSNRSMMPSDMVVGKVDPVDMGLEKGVLPSVSKQMQQCSRICEKYDDEGETMSFNMASVPLRSALLSSNLPRKNLVVLIRFSDHFQRKLPGPSDYEILFNSPGGHPILAPSGSIRDLYEKNSYGSLQLDSRVYGWVTLPQTEAYYADGQSGFTDKFLEVLGDALDVLDSDSNFDFSHFDSDGDRTVDTFTLLHSGYGAEWGSMDGFGQSRFDRIWSHQWSLPSWRHWISRTGFRVNKYSVSPGLWGTSGFEIGRIGVIAHEIGHYLGLPDLYGGAIGHGIGSWGMMANSWGFDGSQRWPPYVSAWGKLTAGWTQPTSIDVSGRYSIGASATSPDVYRIDLSHSGSEYLLIENRQRIDFDRNLPQGGLAIWHIDEKAGHMRAGYPGEDGWPANGNHYKIALLQADGNYDLEQGTNRGDSGDLFHALGVDQIGPSDSLSGPYPNTDAYQGGVITRSDINIFDISVSRERMEFSVSFGSIMQAPTDLPSRLPTSLPTLPPTFGQTRSTTTEIVTTFVGGNGAAGNMFDIVSKSDIVLYGMQIHSRQKEVTTVEIWTKEGSHRSFEQDKGIWTRLLEMEVVTVGMGRGTAVQLDPLPVKSGEIRALYVTVVGGAGLRYTNGQGVGTVVAENADLKILEGVGKAYPFGRTYMNRQWNGVIQYALEPKRASSSPSHSPSEEVSQSPTMIRQMPINEQQLRTTLIGGTQQSGNMFDILAFKNIMITGFDVHLTTTDQTMVEIYTKVDSYVGSETDCQVWDLITIVSVQGKGIGNPTFVPLSNADFITIDRYRIQAFYITLQTPNMRYTRGPGRGNVVASDPNLAIFEGVGKAYPCSSTYYDRVWNGAIRYVAQERSQWAPPSPSPTFTNMTTSPKELVTTFIGGKQAAGNMFDITTSASLVITGLKIHTRDADIVTVEIFAKEGSYVGYEQIASAWTKITSAVFYGMGRGLPSKFPSGAFEPISILRGNTVAMYVTLTTEGMRYSTGNGSSEAALNADMVISEGVGVEYPFGRIFQDRIWNGVLEYNLP